MITQNQPSQNDIVEVKEEQEADWSQVPVTSKSSRKPPVARKRGIQTAAFSPGIDR